LHAGWSGDASRHFASSAIHRAQESTDGIAIERRAFRIEGVVIRSAGEARDPSRQRAHHGLKLRPIDAIRLHDCVRQGIAEQIIDRQFLLGRGHGPSFLIGQGRAALTAAL
jgi:hypothetical protein